MRDEFTQVNIAPIVERWGGALNCLSWTMSNYVSSLFSNII